MSEEMFDVVNERDEVLYAERRSVVHRDRLLHRAVQILVFDEVGRLLVHQRSATKDEAPLLFNTSASGHVGAGETYELAAQRELQEELGIETPITFLAKFPASKETSWEHTWLCRTTVDLRRMSLTPCPDEILQIRWTTYAELAAWIATRPDEFTPGFRMLFAWVLDNVPDKGLDE